MTVRKEQLTRGLAGGCIAIVLFFIIVFFLNSLSILGSTPDYAHMSFASHSSVQRFGSHTLALVMELISVFALGAAIGISTLPFADEGPTLIRDSVLHFFVTGALVMFGVVVTVTSSLMAVSPQAQSVAAITMLSKI